jgi:ribosome-interacting GTPase 1
MPTNLPPEAKNKWEEVEAAKNPHEKLRLLQEFLSLIPRHHGTTKLEAQTKKRITLLRKEIEEKKRKKAGRTGPKMFIQKEGAAQIALIGLTKSGKSSLLAAVTNAKAEISPDPYTTREPIPGILSYKDIQIQIIEAPALMEGSAEGRAWGLQTLGIARNADCVIIMIDLSQDPIEQLSLIMKEMEKARILFSRPRARVEVEKKHMGAGLRIILNGRLVDCTFKNVEELLRNYRITDGVVRISGEATLEEIEDAIFESTVYKPAVIAANKIDVPHAKSNLALLRSHLTGKLPIVAVSCNTKQGLAKLGETLFETVGIMRIYTKEPDEKAYSKKPFILKKGATVYALAKSIHTDLSRRFAFAKVWSGRLAFSPQKVGTSFALEDGDIVEIHVK